MAMNGENHEAVIEAAEHMKLQQRFVFKTGVISGGCLFIASSFFIYAKQGAGIATICAATIIFAFYYIMLQGYLAYKSFTDHKTASVSFDENDTKSNKKYSKLATEDPSTVETKNGAERLSPKDTPSGAKSVARKQPTVAVTDVMLREKINKIRARGIIWWRSSESSSRCFRKAFAVLERGVVDLYTSEEAFTTHENAVNKAPIQLRKYALITDQRKMKAREIATTTGALRSVLTGTADFSFADSLAADFDVNIALKKYKFALMPKVVSELHFVESFEFVAEDETAFTQWINVLSSSISAVQDSDDLAIKMKGTTDVEVAVQAANL